MVPTSDTLALVGRVLIEGERAVRSTGVEREPKLSQPDVNRTTVRVATAVHGHLPSSTRTNAAPVAGLVGYRCSIVVPPVKLRRQLGHTLGLGLSWLMRRGKPDGTNETTYTSSVTVLLFRTTCISFPWSTKVDPSGNPGPNSSTVQSGAW